MSKFVKRFQFYLKYCWHSCAARYHSWREEGAMPEWNAGYHASKAIDNAEIGDRLGELFKRDTSNLKQIIEDSNLSIKYAY